MPSQAFTAPSVSFADSKPDKFYTLFMTDPDAPSPLDPVEREWVHWMVTDIEGGEHMDGEWADRLCTPGLLLAWTTLMYIFYDRELKTYTQGLLCIKLKVVRGNAS